MNRLFGLYLIHFEFHYTSMELIVISHNKEELQAYHKIKKIETPLITDSLAQHHFTTTQAAHNQILPVKITKDLEALLNS